MTDQIDLTGARPAPAASGAQHPALGADDPHAARNADMAGDALTSAERPDPHAAQVRDDGDVFALLSTKAAEAQAEAAEMCEVFGYRERFRMRAITHVDEKPMRKWQKMAVPAHKRKGGGQISQFEVDNLILSTQCILGTVRELAVWSDARGDYVDIPSESECPFEDRKVLSALGELLPANGVRKVFGGKDALIVTASSKIMAYAGWNPDQSMIEADADEDDLDPTPGR